MSVFTSRLHRDGSLAANRTKVEEETMSTSDLGIVANQLVGTLGESPERKTTPFSIFNSRKYQPLMALLPLQRYILGTLTICPC